MDRQTSFFEHSDELEHVCLEMVRVDGEWVAHCTCGWQSAGHVSSGWSLREWRSHELDTPGVKRLLEIVRRPGRFGQE